MSNEKVKIGIALAAGLCIGGGLGYVWAEHKIRSETEAEIAGVKDLFRRLRDEDAEQAAQDWNPPIDEEEDSDQASEEGFDEKAVDLGYAKADDLWTARYQDPNYRPPTENDIDKEETEEEEYVRRIRFVDPNQENDPNDVTKWDRSSDVPYVITEAEYRIDMPEHEKLSLTYYKGDDTLAEADGSYIPDLEGTVGSNNLQYFGLASGDDLTLHVRNERVMADFEVTLDEGAYSRDVLGFGIEESMVKESKKGIKKMRSRE